MTAQKRKRNPINELAEKKVEIYDTTLRDGAQAEGIAFSLEDKLMIAEKLDELGVDYIEGGYPLSNAKDEAFFREVRKRKLSHSQVVAFGMTRRKNVKAEDDTSLLALHKCQAKTVAIVAKASKFQATQVLGATAEQNLQMITDSVRFLRKKGRQVFFDAEHYFDAYKEDPQYALKTLEAAAEAGATRLILCDTNGGCLEPEIAQITAATVDMFPTLVVGVHCHNDAGVAVANSLTAIRAGARHVQGTINGFGERAGNADLCAIIPNLALKMGFEALPPDRLKHLTEVSRFVYDLANLNLPLNQPYVGSSSFAHKGGMHVHAVSKVSRSYEHISPEAVGNTRRILISELSGASNLLAKHEKLAMLENRDLVRKVLTRVQDLENEGYQFETADASFDLIVRRFLGNYRTFFDLDHYRAVIFKASGGRAVTEAIVKIGVNGLVEHTVAEGDGPVNALDQALRKALERHYPVLREMQLMDYRVRVVNPKAATAARVRVVIESRDKHHHWGTVGVDANIIDASWKALVESFEYKLLDEVDRTGE